MKKIFALIMASLVFISSLTVTPYTISASDKDFANRNTLFNLVKQNSLFLEKEKIDEINEQVAFNCITDNGKNEVELSYYIEKCDGTSVGVKLYVNLNKNDFDVIDYFTEYDMSIETYHYIKSASDFSLYNSKITYEIVYPKDINEVSKESLDRHLNQWNDSLIIDGFRIIDSLLKKYYNLTLADLGYRNFFTCSHENVQSYEAADASTGTNGKCVSKCKKCGYTSERIISCPAKIKVSNVIYTGKSKKPKFTVIGKNGKIIPGKYYNVTYNSKTKVGKSDLKVTFKGPLYKGTLKQTYKIIPKSTQISKISSKSGKLIISLKKQKNDASAYEIWVSKDKNFKKGVKKVTISKNKYNATFKKLSKNKKYFVKARTFKNIKKTKYYSKWSKVKTVKVK